jgi:hypothetical protein
MSSSDDAKSLHTCSFMRRVFPCWNLSSLLDSKRVKRKADRSVKLIKYSEFLWIMFTYQRTDPCDPDEPNDRWLEQVSALLSWRNSCYAQLRKIHNRLASGWYRFGKRFNTYEDSFLAWVLCMRNASWSSLCLLSRLTTHLLMFVGETTDVKSCYTRWWFSYQIHLKRFKDIDENFLGEKWAIPVYRQNWIRNLVFHCW